MPTNREEYFKRHNITKDSFPEAAKIAYHSIALPVGPHLNEGDADYIVKSVKDVLSKIV